MHLLPSNTFSGAENVVCQIIELFRDNSDIEMIYVSPSGPISESLRIRKVNYYGLKKFDFHSIKKAIDKLKPNVIHAHDVRSSIIAAMVAPKSVKVISHIHVNNSDMSKVNLKTILYTILSKRFKHIFWVSNSCYDGYFFNKYVKNKSSILFNIIDEKDVIEKSKHSINKQKYDIVYIGRLQYQKNPEKLLNVFKMIKEGFDQNFRAAIIGDGRLYEEILQKKSTLGLDSNVDMLGFINNPMGILSNSKIMLMTSRFEGTPMCALEAMALGIPIVSTPTDGMINLIDQGSNGYLYEDDLNIAKAAYDLISNSSLRIEFSYNTKNKFKQLNNLKDYKNKLNSIYYSL